MIFTQTEKKSPLLPGSYYAHCLEEPLVSHASAQGHIKTQVCIIGAGLTGLNAAIYLAQRGYEVVVLEAKTSGWGASGRNGGQVHRGYALCQETMEDQLDKGLCLDLWDLSHRAVLKVEDMIKTHDISCDLSRGVVVANHRKRHIDHSRRYVDHLARDYKYHDMSFLNPKDMKHLLQTGQYQSGYIDHEGLHLHPLNYTLGLARVARNENVQFFHQSPATHIKHGPPAVVTTPKAKITCDFVVLACNGYLSGALSRPIERQVLPLSNFIVTTNVLEPSIRKRMMRKNVAVCDQRFVARYFRLTKDHRLLFGAAEAYGQGCTPKKQRQIEKRLYQMYPFLNQVGISHMWGGQLGITRSRLPCFQALAPHIYNVSGFSGHGIALGSLAGEIVGQAIEGQAGYFDLYSRLPTPPFPGGRFLQMPLSILGMTWYRLRDLF